ncbi:MAG: hypothetical protein IIU77_03160 [Clostridia bacterium]|nr:hypothetical protein [Clostridia bacterium]
MKKLISFILILATLLSCFIMFGCKKDSPDDENSVAVFNITSDYKISIPKDYTQKELSIAKDIQTAIKKLAGISLPINDSGKAVEKEIVIGDADRPELKNISEKVGENLGFTIFASNPKIFIYGTDRTYLGLAAEEFIETYIDENNKSLIIHENLSVVRSDIGAKKDLTIGGVAIEKFIIVYGEEGYTSPLKDNKNFMECGRYEDVAKALAKEIKLLTGKTVRVISSRNSAKQPHEILIGQALKRKEDDAYFNTKHAIEDYSFGVINGNLVLSGGSANATYFAGRAFITACAEMEGSDFNKAPQKGKAKFIKVACVGDSITHGAYNESNYPMYLQKMLGFDYYVGNYGWPGIRMTNYAGSTDHVESCKLKPDVVILMLGTNDAYHASDHSCDMEKEAYRTNYKNCGKAILKKFRSLNANVQFFIMTPPSILPNAAWQNGVKKAAAINIELAEEFNGTVIDMYQISKDKKWNFPDKVHPSEKEGYLAFAEAVYENLKDTIVK